MKRALTLVAIATIFFGCQKEYIFNENLPGSNTSVFTLSGNAGSCSITVSGSFFNGTALTASNTVSIQVNVTTAGSYAITTNTINGYNFTASGTFATTGPQTINLVGSGTPLAAQTDGFTINTSGSACTFNIVVGSAAPAVFTLSGGTGACIAATVNGNYAINTVLVAANTVSVQVDVATIGSYSISTNTVAGFSFSKSGSFTTTGIQSVVLNGTGTPTAAGTTAFSVGTAGCTFNVQVAGPAVYSMGGAPGACTQATIAGSYATGVTLTSSNTVTVQVNVTTAGAYTINTNTVGGMSFTKSGIFNSTGSQTVVFTGSGTPTTGGANLFTVGTAGCTFSIPVTGPATFSFSGAPGVCTVATVNGTYTAGSTLNSSNTVSLQVNVTATGAYNISTTSGGMTFSKSGIFTATGNQTIVLLGSGTVTTLGVNNFTVGTGGCTFSITVAAPTGIYNCKIDGVYTSFTDRAKAEIMDDYFTPATPYLYLDGYTGPPNGNTVPHLQIFITKNDNSVVGPGSYNVDGYIQPANGYRLEIDYFVVNPDQSVTIWNTSSNIFPPPHPPFTVIVTSVTSTRVKGTFSGQVTNVTQGSTQTKNITEGVFDLPIM